MESRIFHPDLMQHIARNRFGSRGDVQRRTTTQDDYGQEVIAYINDPLLVALVCQVSPRTTRSDTEVRRPDQTVVTKPFDMLLDGYYPTISEQDQIVITTTGDIHNILKVAHDSTSTYTTLTTEIVNG